MQKRGVLNTPLLKTSIGKASMFWGNLQESTYLICRDDVFAAI